MSLFRKLVAEFLGTAFLLTTVVGSGISGDALSDGNIAIALLANSISTGAILVVLIMIFAPLSGAHFNPAVSLSFWLQRQIPTRDAILYIIVQIAGAFAGTIAAHAMFGEPMFSPSTTDRTGFSQWIGEFIATFGLIATIMYKCFAFFCDVLRCWVCLFRLLC